MKNKKKFILIIILISLILILFLINIKIATAIDPKKSLDSFLIYLDELSSKNKINQVAGEPGKLLTLGQIIYESWWNPAGNPLEKNQKQLFHYYGYDADCITMAKKKEEICLLNKNAFNEKTNCSAIRSREEKICQSKHPFWGAGTTQIAGNLAIAGAGLLFNMGDSSGMHWIMSALQEGIYNTIGFSKNEQSIFFNRDIYIEKNLTMNQKKRDGSNDIENNIFLTDKSILKQNNNNLEILNPNLTINLLKNNNVYRTNFIGGLEIEDYLKTNKIIFQNSFLTYCEQTSGDCYQSDRLHNENFIFATSTDVILENLFFIKKYK